MPYSSQAIEIDPWQMDFENIDETNPFDHTTYGKAWLSELFDNETIRVLKDRSKPPIEDTGHLLYPALLVMKYRNEDVILKPGDLIVKFIGKAAPQDQWIIPYTAEMYSFLFTETE